MFRGIFGRIYYGKDSNKDLTAEDMKVSRFQLFFQLLRTHWFTMVKLNMMTLPFALPLLLWITFILYTALNTIYTGFTGVITPELTNEMTNLVFHFVVYLIPCLLILAPGLGAMMGVCRKLADDEHIWLWDEFKTQLKQNWKQSLVILGVDGVMLLLFVWITWLYGQSLTINPTFVISVLRYLFIFMAAILVMSIMYQLPMMATYELKVVDILRNSVLLSLVRLHFTLLFTLLALLPVVICLVATFFWSIAIGFLTFYYMIFGMAFTGFIISSYTNASFDRYFSGAKKD